MPAWDVCARAHAPCVLLTCDSAMCRPGDVPSWLPQLGPSICTGPGPCGAAGADWDTAGRERLVTRTGPQALSCPPPVSLLQQPCPRTLSCLSCFASLTKLWPGLLARREPQDSQQGCPMRMRAPRSSLQAGHTPLTDKLS